MHFYACASTMVASRKEPAQHLSYNGTKLFFHGLPCAPERNEKLSAFRLGQLAGMFSKINKWACDIKRYSWQCLLPMITFEFQRKIGILENIYATVNVPTSQHPKTFLM